MIEKGKVSELEMRLKAAELSRHVAKTLEKQYTSSIVLKHSSSSLSVNKGSPDKANDDSGYTDMSQDKSRGSSNKGLVTGQNDDRDILDQIASLQAELVSLKHSFKNHNETSEQEPSLNIDNFLQQKSNYGESSEIIDGDFASHTRDIGNIDALLSVSRDRGEDTNDDSNQECHKKTDEYNSKDQILASTGNVSRIPRLKQIIRSVITELKHNEIFKNKTPDSNVIDNEETATLLNDDSYENKIDKSDGNKFINIGANGNEVYNEVVNNRRTDLNIRNSEIKQNNDHVIKTSTISNKQLSKGADCSKKKTVVQTSMSESNAANIAQENALLDNSKDQTVANLKPNLRNQETI
ncbi:uncharacterized protein LOC135193454 [Vanessa tameamea]|uniref:Uncharacterized protein LOC135193454 n=1 Tax=Vanessa tameamea TaxID=334116 RepID=A0ABM4AL91_VANTA